MVCTRSVVPLQMQSRDAEYWDSSAYFMITFPRLDICTQYNDNNRFWEEDVKKAFPALRSDHTDYREVHYLPQNECLFYCYNQHTLSRFSDEEWLLWNPSIVKKDIIKINIIVGDLARWTVSIGCLGWNTSITKRHALPNLVIRVTIFFSAHLADSCTF